MILWICDLCDLICKDQATCEGRFYMLPFWIKIPEIWPAHSDSHV